MAVLNDMEYGIVVVQGTNPAREHAIWVPGQGLPFVAEAVGHVSRIPCHFAQPFWAYELPHRREIVPGAGF